MEYSIIEAQGWAILMIVQISSPCVSIYQEMGSSNHHSFGDWSNALIISTLIIQTVANHYSLENGSINNTCLFLEASHTHIHTHTHTQHLWVSHSNLGNLLWNCCTSITIYESPHVMKGLLLGVFYVLGPVYHDTWEHLNLPIETLWGDQPAGWLMDITSLHDSYKTIDWMQHIFLIPTMLLAFYVHSHSI